MRFDDFYGKALPKMIHRVKILFYKQEFHLFEYGEEFEPPYLYLKSRFMNEEMDSYAEQVAFDNQLETLNLFDLSDYGPNPTEFIHSLSLARWQIDGMRLIRSQSIPNLDTPCGMYFTYLDFIICGETQARTDLSNLPKEADFYTAIYELATNILDPVRDSCTTVFLEFFCICVIYKINHLKMQDFQKSELCRGLSYRLFWND